MARASLTQPAVEAADIPIDRVAHDEEELIALRDVCELDLMRVQLELVAAGVGERAQGLFQRGPASLADMDEVSSFSPMPSTALRSTRESSGGPPYCQTRANGETPLS